MYVCMAISQSYVCMAISLSYVCMAISQSYVCMAISQFCVLSCKLTRGVWIRLVAQLCPANWGGLAKLHSYVLQTGVWIRLVAQLCPANWGVWIWQVAVLSCKLTPMMEAENKFPLWWIVGKVNGHGHFWWKLYYYKFERISGLTYHPELLKYLNVKLNPGWESYCGLQVILLCVIVHCGWCG